MATTMARRRGPRPLTSGIQLAFLKRIGFRGSTRCDVLDVTGELHPSATSDRYVVRIRYRIGESPRVTVLDPPLRGRADGERIPHAYKGLEPCLYLPSAGEWGPADKISETIVPWANEWLYYYEAWHATGKWFGGGVHPRARAKRLRRAR